MENNSEVSDATKLAAEVYADKHGFRVPFDGSNNFYDDNDVKWSIEGFIAGAKWQRQQSISEYMRLAEISKKKLLKNK